MTQIRRKKIKMSNPGTFIFSALRYINAFMGEMEFSRNTTFIYQERNGIIKMDILGVMAIGAGLSSIKESPGSYLAEKLPEMFDKTYWFTMRNGWLFEGTVCQFLSNLTDEFDTLPEMAEWLETNKKNKWA